MGLKLTKTASAIVDFLKEEPLVAKELKNFVATPKELIAMLGIHITLDGEALYETERPTGGSCLFEDSENWEHLLQQKLDNEEIEIHEVINFLIRYRKEDKKDYYTTRAPLQTIQVKLRLILN